MKPTPPDFKIQSLIQELRNVPIPRDCAQRTLAAMRSAPQAARRTAVLARLALGASGAIGVAALALSIMAQPTMAFSQVVALNDNHVNIVAETSAGFSRYTTEVSGRRYSIVNKFQDGRPNHQPALKMEIEWDFDGSRFFMGTMLRNRGRADIGIVNGQKFGVIQTASHFTPWEVTSLRSTPGHFDPTSANPVFFPFDSPTKLEKQDMFDGQSCDVYAGSRLIKQEPPHANMGAPYDESKGVRVIPWGLISGKIYVDPGTHRILGKGMTFITGETAVTRYRYPASLPDSDFRPRPDWKVYDLDAIRAGIEAGVDHPHIARTPKGDRVKLVAALKTPEGDLMILWLGTPPNGIFDHPAVILGNPNKLVYGVPELTVRRVLLSPRFVHRWHGQLLAGQTDQPAYPVGRWVDLKVPSFREIRSRPIKNKKGKVLGYESTFEGYAQFRHVSVIDVPGDYSSLEQ
jgi:hypothetical protein